MSSVGYILGAGFSQAFGIPSTATLLKSILNPPYPRFRTIRVLQWQTIINNYLKANYLGYWKESTLPDIVQLMNHMYLSDELKRIFEGISTIEEDWTILIALVSTYLYAYTIWVGSDDTFDRKHIQLFTKHVKPDDVIVTLNWDTLLEHAFVNWGGEDLEEGDLPFVLGRKVDGKISIYKLHGSIDFMGMPNAGMEKYWKEFPPLNIGQSEPMWRVRTYDRRRAWKPDLPWELVNKSPMLLAPPASVHYLEMEFTKLMWRNCVDHLKECNRFVVIGYALPRDDYFIQMILSALYNEYHKSKGTKFIIIDPDPTGEVGLRWKLLLGDAVSIIRKPLEQTYFCEA